MFRRLFSKKIKVGLYVTIKDTCCSSGDITNIIGNTKYGPIKEPLNYEQTKQVYQG